MHRRRLVTRWAAVASLAASVAVGATTALQAATTYVVNNTGTSSQGGEIVAITPNNRTALVVGSNTSVQSVRSLAINADGTLGNTLSVNFQNSNAVKSLTLSKPVASSIAVHPTEGYAIATIQESDSAKITSNAEAAGGALFVNVNPDTGALAIARTSELKLGIHPESVAISPNGKYAIVANKDPGSAVGDNAQGGTISVVDLRNGINSASVKTTLSPSVPAGNNTRKQLDPAPETAVINDDGTRAYVTLQENSALAIITIDPNNLSTSMNVVALPKTKCSTSPAKCEQLLLLSDGIASTITRVNQQVNQYLVTANKGVGTVRPDSVSLLKVNSPTSVPLLWADSSSVISDTAVSLGITRPSRGFEPDQVDIAQVGGELKAFVTLSSVSAIAVFNLNPDAPNEASRLVLDQIVRLDQASPAGNNPKGIDVVNTFGNQTLAITANKGANRNLSVITANGDNPTVGFSSEIFNTREDDGQAQVTVTLNSSSYQEVRVNYSTSNGTAVAGVDYTATSGTLIFAPGETSKTFPIELINNLDANPGAEKTVNLLLDTAVNSSIPDPTATLRITDDETTILEFSALTYSVNENGGNATIRVNRAGGLGQAVSVQVATSDGSATAGSDYTAVSETLNFGASDTFKDVTIPITNDTLVDPDETVNLTLSNQSNGARLGTQTTATLTITDDEPLPVASFAAANFDVKESDGTAIITVNLSGPSTKPVTVNYTTGDVTASSGSDYVAVSGALTFAPGETTKTFSILVATDNADEPSETVALALTSASGATIGSAPGATLTIENSKSSVGAGKVIYLPIARK